MPAASVAATPAAAPADATARIIGTALADEGAWRKLEFLTTRIGNRVSGSASLEAAIQWAARTMRDEGLENVQLQPAKVPHWVRGRESARIVAPVERKLPLLGLGLGVGTPAGGITAPVVVVRSFEELSALGRERVEGKIVAFAPEWEGYGKTVRFRSRGASAAAKLGAVAVLVRAATGRSIATPHTGMVAYEAGVPKIPAACITVEDAEWLKRMAAAGETVKVALEMEASQGEVDSANVMAEIRGRERPDEVVVMGGHSDSWDVGQGAHDDGCACAAAWQALKLIKDLGLRPRRTLRVVFWVGGELGKRRRAYRDALGDAVSKHVAAIEMDGGCERPAGFGFTAKTAQRGRRAGGRPGEQDPASRRSPGCARRRAVRGFDAGQVRWGGGGSDIGPLMRAGVPGLSLDTVGEHYFDWHHTQADTLDKVQPVDLQRAVALLGAMGWALAEREQPLLPAPAPTAPAAPAN